MSVNVNVGEYGLALNLNVNFDVSGASGLTLSFTRPDGSTFAGVAVVGVVDLVTDDRGTFSAKKYVRYVLKDGDLTIPGEYRVRLVYTDSAPKRLVSGYDSFIVDA